MSAHFDPLEYAQQLETAGVPKAQAEVHARTLGHVIDDCVAAPDDLASSRRDMAHVISETETRLRVAISKVESQLRAEISQLESRLLAEISQLESRLLTKISQVESRFRAEMQELEARLNSKLEIMEARLNSRIDELRTELRFHRWVSGVTLAFVVATFAQSLRVW